MPTIRIDAPELTLPLRDFFRGVQAIAVERAPGVVDVHLPGALDPAKELAEVRAYLATWLGMHEGVSGEARAD